MSAILLSLLIGSAVPDCSRGDLTQAEMNDCAVKAFNEADASLNKQWQKTLRAFHDRSTQDVERLRAAQRIWIAFRDAECDAEYPWDLGVSLDKMLNVNCRTDMTLERTAKLAELGQGL